MTDESVESKVEVQPPMTDSDPGNVADKIGAVLVDTVVADGDSRLRRVIGWVVYCIVKLAATLTKAAGKAPTPSAVGIAKAVGYIGLVVALGVFLFVILDDIVKFALLLIADHLIGVAGHIAHDIGGSVYHLTIEPVATELRVGLLAIGASVIGVAIFVFGGVIANNWRPQPATTISRLSTADAGIQLESGTNSISADLSNQINSMLPDEYDTAMAQAKPLVASPGSESELGYDDEDDTTLVVGVVSAKVPDFTWETNQPAEQALATERHIRNLNQESEETAFRNLTESIIDAMAEHDEANIDLVVDNRVVASTGLRVTDDSPTVSLHPIIVAIGAENKAVDAVEDIGQLYAVAYDPIIPSAVDIQCSITTYTGAAPDIVTDQIAQPRIPAETVVPLISGRTGIVVDAERLSLLAPVVDTTRREFASLERSHPTDQPRPTPKDNLDDYRDEPDDEADEPAEEADDS